ncbi:MAG: HEAT repeat domain-containing protein [Planctomycetes bacterium]|nr:HEAT repeat domain-containing protein [Planctomycetota bacterium]
MRTIVLSSLCIVLAACVSVVETTTPPAQLAPDDLGQLQRRAMEISKGNPELRRAFDALFAMPWEPEPSIPPRTPEEMDLFMTSAESEAMTQRNALASTVMQVASLAGCHRKECSRILVRFLEHPHGHVCWAASNALTTLRVRAVAPDIAGLLGHHNPETRQWAMHALVSVGGVDYAPEIVGRLEDENDQVRQGAILAIGHLETTTIASQVAAYLSHEREVVRLAAAIALYRLGHDGQWPPDDSGIVSTMRTWWETHKDDPEFRGAGQVDADSGDHSSRD